MLHSNNNTPHSQAKQRNPYKPVLINHWLLFQEIQHVFNAETNAVKPVALHNVPTSTHACLCSPFGKLSATCHATTTTWSWTSLFLVWYNLLECKDHCLSLAMTGLWQGYSLHPLCSTSEQRARNTCVFFLRSLYKVLLQITFLPPQSEFPWEYEREGPDMRSGSLIMYVHCNDIVEGPRQGPSIHWKMHRTV